MSPGPLRGVRLLAALRRTCLLPTLSLVVGIICGTPRAVHAQTSDAPLSPSSASSVPAAAPDMVPAAAPTSVAPALPPVRFDPWLDGALTAGGFAVTAALELTNRWGGGAPCRWCDRDGNGRDTLNAFDAGARDHLAWKDLTRAQLLSNVTVFALLPVGTLWPWLTSDPGFSPRARWEEVGLMAESTAFALLADQMVKFTVRRERPFVHTLTPDARDRTSMPWDNNTSFYSAHATFSFALASSATTLALLRKSRWTPAIAAGGYGLAAAVAYLRLAGGKHYATDVLVGAGAGTLIGIAVPLLHRTTTGSSSGSGSGSWGILSWSPDPQGHGGSLRWSQVY